MKALVYFGDLGHTCRRLVGFEYGIVGLGDHGNVPWREGVRRSQ